MLPDEMELRVTVGEPKRSAMAAWRSTPPEPLQASGLTLSDETLETLIYEGRHSDLNQKILTALSLGLMKVNSVWRLTVRFDPEGDYRTQITMLGKIDEATRTGLARWAEEHGTVAFAAGTGPPAART